MPVSTQKKAAPAATSTPKKFDVMLGNDCQRYVVGGDQGANGKLYEAGVRYNVTAAERASLFAHVDDAGVRYFYDAEVILRQRAASAAKGRKQRIAAGEEDDGDRQQEELDTAAGAMSLRDESGEPVGTKSDRVAV